MPEVTFVYSDAGLRGSDAMVSEVEALCQSGVDAVIAYLPSAPMADVCKKYGDVPVSSSDVSVDVTVVSSTDCPVSVLPHAVTASIVNSVAPATIVFNNFFLIFSSLKYYFLLQTAAIMVQATIGNTLAIDVLIALMIGGFNMSGGIGSKISQPIIGSVIIEKSNA